MTSNHPVHSVRSLMRSQSEPQTPHSATQSDGKPLPEWEVRQVRSLGDRLPRRPDAVPGASSASVPPSAAEIERRRAVFQKGVEDGQRIYGPRPVTYAPVLRVLFLFVSTLVATLALIVMVASDLQVGIVAAVIPSVLMLLIVFFRFAR